MFKRKIYIIFVISCPIFVFAQQYNPSKAIQYAERWWNDFNTKKNGNDDTIAKWGGPYVNYSKMGGDCASFASQCLIYGGLDLSAGTDGHGAYVKPEGVIAGAKELLIHLKDIQKFPYQAVTGGSSKAEPSFMAPGHLAILEVTPGVRHTIFCTSVINGRNVYNSHSDSAYHKKRSYWSNFPDAHYVNVGAPPPLPAHCENCRQDGDELGLDCGGSCPPCEDAPQNRVVDQNNLKQENYAMESLTTNGSLILTGEKVTFAAGEEVVLNPGFEVLAGTEFIAKTSSNPNDLTRNFRKVCVTTANSFTPNGDGFNDMYGVWVAGITSVSIRIASRWGNTVRNSGTNVYEDGLVPLWNGKNDSNGRDCATGTYFYEIIVTTYEGNTSEYRGYMTLLR